MADNQSLSTTKGMAYQMEVYEAPEMSGVTDAIKSSTQKAAETFSQSASKSSGTIVGAIKDSTSALITQFAMMLDNAVADYVSAYNSNYSTIYGYYKLNNSQLNASMKDVTARINNLGLKSTIAAQDVIRELSKNSQLGLNSDLALSKSFEDAILTGIEPYVQWSSTSIGDLVRSNNSVDIERSIAGVGRILENSGMERFYQSGQYNAMIDALSYGLSANNRTTSAQTSIIGTVAYQLGSMTQRGVVIADSTISALTQSLGNVVTNPLLAAMNEQDPLMLAAMAQAGVVSTEDATATDLANITMNYMQMAQQIGGTAASILSGKSWTDDNISGALANMSAIQADLSAGKLSEDAVKEEYAKILANASDSKTYEQQMLNYVANIANKIGASEWATQHPVANKVVDTLTPVIKGLIGASVAKSVLGAAIKQFTTTGAVSGLGVAKAGLSGLGKGVAKAFPATYAALSMVTDATTMQGSTGYGVFADGLRGAFFGTGSRQKSFGENAVSILGNAAKGAAIGAAIPVIGPLAGGIAGAALGIIGALNDNKAAVEENTSATATNTTQSIEEAQRSAEQSSIRNETRSSLTYDELTTNKFEHREGITNVPYDGYPATLHQSEEVVSSASKQSVVTAAKRATDAATKASASAESVSDTRYSYSTANYDSIISAINAAADKIAKAVSTKTDVLPSLDESSPLTSINTPVYSL